MKIYKTLYFICLACIYTSISAYTLTQSDLDELEDCPRLKVAINQLENVASTQSTSIDELTKADWLKITKTYLKSPAYIALTPVTALTKSSSRCDVGTYDLTSNLNYIIKNNKLGDYYYNLSLIDGYFYTHQNEKLTAICPSMKDALQYYCYYRVINLADFSYNSDDFKGAIRLYYIASKHDNSGISQRHLAYMYVNGLGTDINLDKGIYWYSEALRQDEKQKYNEEIMYDMTDLGTAYFQKQDYITAFNAFLTASKMGYSEAQFKLAMSYTQGYGVIQDNKNAYAWVSTAIAQGLPDSNTQSDAENLRRNLINVLNIQDETGKDLKDAQALAKQYYQQYALHQTLLKPLSFSERLRRAIHAFNS